MTKVAVAASVVLIGTAFAFYWLAGADDADAYQRISGDIRQIRQLSTEWSVETARVRSDPMGDYDALAAFIPEVGQLKRELLDAVRDRPAMPERLANDVYAFASALDAKEERIERFKSSNSVIRNSVRYLPNAAASITGSTPDPALADDVAALADGLGLYSASPTDEAKGRLTAIHDRLVALGDGLPADQAGTLSNFLAHAGVLLDRQGPAERTFRLATSAEVADLAGELVAEFDAQSANMARRAELHMLGCWVAAALLLLVWVFVVAVRSRPAAQAAKSVAEPDVATLPAPAAAEVAANGSRVHSQSDQEHALRKQLTSQRILTEVVGASIARAVRELPVGSDAKAVNDVAGIAGLAESFASASTTRNERYDLVDLKECAAAALAAAGADDGAKVVADLGETPQIFASKDELCLMLEQVLDNAAWAIRDKGLDPEEGEIRVKTASANGGATVTVFDNGIGVAADDRDRMFDPFVGTRDDRPGVGLAITRHVVRKYGGRIAVGSQPGGGTVLRINLPGMSE